MGGLATFIGAGLVSMLVLTGCGGGEDASTDLGPASSTTEAAQPVKTEPETTVRATTTEQPTTTTTEPPTVQPGDTVAVACDDETGVVKVLTIDPSTGARTTVHSTTVPGTVECQHRHSFSLDFAKVLTEIDDPDGGDRTHIAVVDLATGTATDLTAARVRPESFSATPLNEYSPGFLGPGGPPLAYGSDEVVFFREAETHARVTSLADPTRDDELAPLTAGCCGVWSDDAGGHVERLFRDWPEHQEMLVSGYAVGPIRNTYGTGETDLPNPSGTLILRGGVRRADATVDDANPLDCSESVGGTDLAPIGWIDDTRVALFSDFRTEGGYGSHSGTFAVATLSPDGSVASCTGNLIPSNDTTFTGDHAELTLDGSAMEFTATPLGGETRRYRVPISGGEPMEVPGAVEAEPGGEFVLVYRA